MKGQIIAMADDFAAFLCKYSAWVLNFRNKSLCFFLEELHFLTMLCNAILLLCNAYTAFNFHKNHKEDFFLNPTKDLCYQP